MDADPTFSHADEENYPKSPSSVSFLCVCYLVLASATQPKVPIKTVFVESIEGINELASTKVKHFYILVRSHIASYYV